MEFQKCADCSMARYVSRYSWFRPQSNPSPGLGRRGGVMGGGGTRRVAGISLGKSGGGPVAWHLVNQVAYTSAVHIGGSLTAAAAAAAAEAADGTLAGMESR